MKQRMKKLLAMGLTAVMLTSLAIPAMAAEGDLTKVTNTKGRPIYFVDSGISTLMSDEVEFYKKAIQSNHIFQDWVSLAYNIFESQSKTHWDGDWDDDFGKGGYIDFMDCMLNKRDRWIHETLVGTNMWGYISSGLSVANSLAEVQRRAADDIAVLPNRKLDGSDFLARHDMSEVLTDDSRLVLYSTVSDFDRYGTDAAHTHQIGYDSFTIAFYDFQLHVVDSEDELDATTIVENTTDDDRVVIHATNNSKVDGEESITLDKSVSESLSTSLTNSESYSFGESLSLSGSYDRKFGEGEKNHAKIQLTGTVSFAQAVETAWTETELRTTDAKKSESFYSIVPAHTTLVSEQSLGTIKLTDTYDCPVGISFKVAIFSMCGTCYDDNAATQSFSTAGYEQRSFVTLFGDSATGADAVESLYQRASVEGHYTDTNYDKSFSYTKGTDDDGDVWCTGLNWNTIRDLPAPSTNNTSITNLKGETDLIYAIDDTYPMSAAGGTTTIYQDSFDTKAGEAIPLYPIASTYIKWQMDDEFSLDRTFDLTVGETFPITSYRVKASDKDGVPYHGFVGTWGTWKIVDNNGKETTSPVARMDNDSVTGSQILTATAPGTIYVKYFIPENTYYTYDGEASTNANISSPAYKVVVSAAPEEEPEPFEGTLEVTGTAEVTVGIPENLNTHFTVTACDPTGKEVEADVSWEAKELPSKGITVAPNGELECTQAGTFHVRAYVDDVYSNWVEVIAAEPVSLILGVSHHPFPDVPYDHWANDAVGFVYQNSIMNGVKADRFDPAGQVTRSQVAQTLYNLAGQPLIVSENPFTDVAEDAWYAKAVTWAAENGLTEGKSADRFAPNDPVTREQLVTFICRYADWKGLELPSKEVDLSQYQDAGEVSGWAKDFVLRALEAGIISGTSEYTLAPQGTATRAQIAQIFMNLLAE